MGPAEKGKGSGSGAMASESVADERLEENMVLSNRDKSRHSDERGLDSRAVQTEQHQDNPMNRARSGDDVVTNTSGTSAPQSTTSKEDSSLEGRADQGEGIVRKGEEGA